MPLAIFALFVAAIWFCLLTGPTERERRKWTWAGYAARAVVTSAVAVGALVLLMMV